MGKWLLSSLMNGRLFFSVRIVRYRFVFAQQQTPNPEIRLLLQSKLLFSFFILIFAKNNIV